MNSIFEANLIEALAALEAGESIEAILAMRPADAKELRPILETAFQLERVPVAHSLSAQATSRTAFLEHAAKLRAQEQRRGAVPNRWRFSLASFALFLAIFILSVGSALTVSAEGALPGQPLYPLKRTVEEVRLSLASGPERREALAAQFQARRREEIYEMLADGLEGRVDCDGQIEAISADSWTLSGLRVEIETTTVVNGEPQPGAMAYGTCRIAQDRIVAETLRVEPTDNIRPEPTPSPTATPTLTATPTRTASATATPTNTPTASRTPAPLPTVTPTLDAVQQPVESEDEVGPDSDGEDDPVDEEDGEDEEEVTDEEEVADEETDEEEVADEETERGEAGEAYVDG